MEQCQHREMDEGRIFVGAKLYCIILPAVDIACNAKLIGGKQMHLHRGCKTI